VEDTVYLVLELAANGDLFDFIIEKEKLTEEQTRKVFMQVFQAVKYLVRFPNSARLTTPTDPT
jgi:serine/threonine-protein kinase Chk2